ncbi:hypothetical protein A3K34_00695 [candidate division WWE3 bacterium RIFOXYC1_FULL_40_10]|uniref:Nudix hydrolase domain-containing protein n=1 Tax=candidate division WWE3 bacterium RIFOXYA2_FULL_46_9 TaxID=1802636 RepID=A0A1F4W4E0_UNCKA|nr:MAG: hypothetical protein A3K58_00695 [candidate division WWE3 bacterium RIFOXYB1_FULL_40_22]OGC61398.1 MAG: hypothetical protein A3K37_00695 [candidate division WWE3 bacterium RIFOXYA1_FULL_40_11]OGC63903.1 MAG: hypothetical protein A2264_02330 [candidate division WWE3 bacterium RIFOXYA2_FULL_46_9]OGC65388.1 MAG: hypothetical protein A2326_04980 [candidate division WWE3 bacterium RIFOXYB2_FULL_41_6]OGC65781.1 MAG: hypothetical protein A3K34_00695 [candidate division WWE3 bacterium RIFOXYC1_
MKHFHRVLPFVNALVIWHTNHILIGRTTSSPVKPYPRFWDLPGGKVSREEQPDEAIMRELREELGIEAVLGKGVFASFHHNGFVRLPECTNEVPGLGLCYLVKEWAGEIVGVEQEEVHFADEFELKSLYATMTPWSAYFIRRYLYELGTS